MLSTALKILAILIAAYLVIVLLAWGFQNRLAFPGVRTRLPPPTAAGIPDGEEVGTVTADGVRLRGWYLPPVPPPSEDSRAPGLIWFYGNMETVAGLAPVIRWLRPPGIGLVILDYRGYGESDGEPTEEGLYRDAEAAWGLLASRPEIDSSRIALYGRSLGSAVALSLTDRHPVRAAILDSPFTSARDMAARHYAIVPSALVRLELNNLARVRDLDVPLLVIHGSEDAIAPIWMGRALADAAPHARLYVIEGAGHNDTYDVGGERYRDIFLGFLREHLTEG